VDRIRVGNLICILFWESISRFLIHEVFFADEIRYRVAIVSNINIPYGQIHIYYLIGEALKLFLKHLLEQPFLVNPRY
jgi:hypothetical protein